MNKNDFDIVVVGGTPAGIMSAIAAARLGSLVALAEYHAHIGGLSTSGLGKSDIENKEAIAGLFKEFTQKVHTYYKNKYGLGSMDEVLCKEGYFYEPSVAELVFNEMIAAEKNITVLLEHQIEGATTASNKVVGAVFKNRLTNEMVELNAKIFVDATYEGDFYALSGAEYRLGREGKDEYGEVHAGKMFMDHNDFTILPGSTGEADKNLPAYTYRLCLTDDINNSYILQDPPQGYNRNNYTAYLSDLDEGRLGGPKVLKQNHGFFPAHFNTMLRVFSFTEIPNRKYDVNINPRPLGFLLAEENKEYVESDWLKRESIFQRHRELILGLLYFVQNDSEVPEEQRKMANQYHLPKDEFKDNEHFPWQLYVREARRLKGKYTLTQNDLHFKNDQSRSTIFNDSIIAGEFPIDSFPVTNESSSDKKVLEGYISMLEIAPYQIPLRIMLPETMNELIVPVAVSTSHVAFSTVRMEPLWMGIGQVAGTLAHISIEKGVNSSSVDVNDLQRLLLERNQILTYFNDLDVDDKAFKAAQFWGTKGFFKTYEANLHAPATTLDLDSWLEIFKSEMEDRYKDTFEEIPTINESMDISGFILSMQGLNVKRGLLESHLIDWLYELRPIDSPLLRGEVCMAFFNLYFGTVDEVK